MGKTIVRWSRANGRSVVLVGLVLLLGVGMAWLLAEDPVPDPNGSSQCPGGGGSGGTATPCPPAQTPCADLAEKKYTRKNWDVGSSLQIVAMTVDGQPIADATPPPMAAYVETGKTITCTLSPGIDTDNNVEQSATVTAPKVRNANNECVDPPQFPPPADTAWADGTPPVPGTGTSQPCVSWSATAGSFDPAGDCSSTSGTTSSATSTTFTAPTATGPVTLTATVKNNDTVPTGDVGERKDGDISRSAVVTVCSVTLDSVELPSAPPPAVGGSGGFVALPDQVTQDRIVNGLSQTNSNPAIPGNHIPKQTVTTEVRVGYALTPSSAFASAVLLVELCSSSHPTVSKSYPLPVVDSGSHVVPLVFDESDAVASDDEAHVRFRVRAVTQAPAKTLESGSITEDGARFVYDLDFSPSSYIDRSPSPPEQEGSPAQLPPYPVCPYTDKHSHEGRPDWYGQDFTFHVLFALGPLDSLKVVVSGGDSGDHDLVYPASALESGLASHVAWEGYDSSLPGDFMPPRAWFPAEIWMHWAPEHVVKEGDYTYSLEAKRTMGELKITQKYENVWIHVRYDLEHVDR